MRRRRLRWYVFGAQAAVTYGRPRMTADVDVVVEVGAADKRGLLQSLGRAGFDLRLDLGEEFLRETNLLPLVHRSTAMPVDVVIASSSLHADLLDRRRIVDVGAGLCVPMISPEDLIVTKVLAGRPKDLEDLRGVLLEQTELDFARIRDLLGQLERALEEPRLLRRFEKIFRATR